MHNLPPLQMQTTEAGVTVAENMQLAYSRHEAMLSEAGSWKSGLPGAPFSGQTLIAYSLVAVWIQFLLPHVVQDPDIWWHLRNVAQQFQDQALLHQDVYSSTAFHASWINHEWLAELPYWLGWHLAGTRGILFVTGAAIELIFMGVYWLACRMSGSWPCATLVTLMASLLSTVSFGPRTLLLGWMCLVVELIVFELSEEMPYVTLGLPVLFLIWINLHGSWLIGMVLFTLFFACGLVRIDRGLILSPKFNPAQRRCLAIALPLSLCALMVNPYGWHLVAYPFDLAFHQALNISHVEEWRSLDLQSSRGAIFLVSLVLLFLAPIITLPDRRRTWTLSELALVAIGSYAAFRHCRFLFLAAILVMPIMGRQLAGMMTPHRPALKHPAISTAPGGLVRFLLNTALLGLLIACQAKVTWSARGVATDTRRFPEAAIPFLKNFRPLGPVFNECLWGGYLAFHSPQIPVFIDSRFDIYERNGTLKDYLDIVGLNNSLFILEKHHVRYVLFERSSPLVYLLQQTHQWHPLYDDGSTILLERSTAMLPSAAAAGVAR